MGLERSHWPPLTAAIETIAVAGQRRGGGATWTEAKAVARRLRAGFAIVKGLGYRLYPSTKSTMYSVPTFLLWVLSRIATMRKLLVTGLNECRALIDMMVAAAVKCKPPLPAAANGASRFVGSVVVHDLIKAGPEAAGVASSEERDALV